MQRKKLRAAFCFDLNLRTINFKFVKVLQYRNSSNPVDFRGKNPLYDRMQTVFSKQTDGYNFQVRLTCFISLQAQSH
jgi:hypothetical protein